MHPFIHSVINPSAGSGQPGGRVTEHPRHAVRAEDSGVLRPGRPRRPPRGHSRAGRGRFEQELQRQPCCAEMLETLLTQGFFVCVNAYNVFDLVGADVP